MYRLEGRIKRPLGPAHLHVRRAAGGIVAGNAKLFSTAAFFDGDSVATAASSTISIPRPAAPAPPPRFNDLRHQGGRYREQHRNKNAENENLNLRIHDQIRELKTLARNAGRARQSTNNDHKQDQNQAATAKGQGATSQNLDWIRPERLFAGMVAAGPEGPSCREPADSRISPIANGTTKPTSKSLGSASSGLKNLIGRKLGGSVKAQGETNKNYMDTVTSDFSPSVASTLGRPDFRNKSKRSTYSPYPPKLLSQAIWCYAKLKEWNHIITLLPYVQISKLKSSRDLSNVIWSVGALCDTLGEDLRVVCVSGDGLGGGDHHYDSGETQSRDRMPTSMTIVIPLREIHDSIMKNQELLSGGGKMNNYNPADNSPIATASALLGLARIYEAAIISSTTSNDSDSNVNTSSDRHNHIGGLRVPDGGAVLPQNDIQLLFTDIFNTIGDRVITDKFDSQVSIYSRWSAPEIVSVLKAFAIMKLRREDVFLFFADLIVKELCGADLNSNTVTLNSNTSKSESQIHAKSVPLCAGHLTSVMRSILDTFHDGGELEEDVWNEALQFPVNSGDSDGAKGNPTVDSALNQKVVSDRLENDLVLLRILRRLVPAAKAFLKPDAHVDRYDYSVSQLIRIAHLYGTVCGDVYCT